MSDTAAAADHGDEDPSRRDFINIAVVAAAAGGAACTDPTALILLAYAEFKDLRFDEAIATTRKAHALEKPHAFAHRVAARAFEQQGQAANAIAELELFLKEAPASPAADGARKELETVKAALR